MGLFLAGTDRKTVFMSAKDLFYDDFLPGQTYETARRTITEAVKRMMRRKA